jgi:hypothetical protein
LVNRWGVKQRLQILLKKEAAVVPTASLLCISKDSFPLAPPLSNADDGF